MTEFHILIPARMGSTRLANKAMADVAGVPLILRVWQRAMTTGALSVHVVTDHEQIFSTVKTAGGSVLMSRADHASGTDRLVEAVDQLGMGDEDIVVNLQGDEPLMPSSCVRQVAALLGADPGAHMATLFDAGVSEGQWQDPDVVKVLVDANDHAICFSRAPIPFFRNGVFNSDAVRRHVGLYAYRVSSLKEWPKLPQSFIEQAEALEQWRALEAGWRIAIAQSKEPIPPGVDNAEDLARVQAVFERMR